MRTIGDIIVSFRGRNVPLRTVAATQPLSVFETYLLKWTQRTQRHDIRQHWEKWKHASAARRVLHAYEPLIRLHFDSIDAFLAAWETYPLAVQRVFPATILANVQQAIQHEYAALSNDVALSFCTQPLSPMSV